MQTNKQKWYRGVLRSLLYHKTSTKKKQKKNKKKGFLKEKTEPFNMDVT